MRANGFGDGVEFRLRMRFWHEKSRNMARNVIIAPINVARKQFYWRDKDLCAILRYVAFGLLRLIWNEVSIMRTTCA